MKGEPVVSAVDGPRQEKREPIVSAGLRPRGERRPSRWPLAIMVLAVLAALAVVPFLLLRPSLEGAALTRYQTATVSRATLTQRVGGAGVVVPRVERSVLASEAGVVASWSVAAGDEVAAGDVLARLQADSLHRELAAAESELASAQRRLQELDLQHAAEAAATADEATSLEAELTTLRADQRLAQELFDLGAASRSELDAAVAAVTATESRLRALSERAGREAQRRRLASEEAQAAVATALAAIETVEARISRLEVVSPVPGRVIEVRAPEGSAVSAGAVLAVVASTTDLSVRVDVREPQASRVVVGQPATVRVAGETYTGSVSWVAPQAHPGESGSMVAVAIDFEGSPPGLRLGGSVTAEIEVGRIEDAAYLPRGLFLATGGERYAFVVDGSAAHRRSVVFGIVDGDRVQVLDGLEVGEEVIVSSYEGIVDRTEVRLDPEGGPVAR